MGSVLPDLPRLIPEKHRWETSKTNPRFVQRRGLGAEAIVGMEKPNRMGQYDLYLLATLKATEVSTAKVLSLAYLKEKLERSLLAVRFQHPDSACTVAWDGEMAPIIQYEVPQSNEDALAWAKNAVHIRITSKTGYDVRNELEEGRKNESIKQSQPSKAATIYVISNVPNENSELTAKTSVDVLLHMNHIFWDGISARLFAGDLLRELSKIIDSTEQDNIIYPWGEEIKNLGAPLLDSLKLDINSLGDEYDISSKNYVGARYANFGGRGLSFKTGLAFPRSDFYIFTVAETEAIIKAVKSRLGPKYSISHLAQAAVIIAMFMANPPTDLSDDDAFVTPMPVNGRRWLRDELQDNYYPMCQTGAVIRVERIKSLLVKRTDEKDVIVNALSKACEDVKNSFDKWLSNPYQLALGITVHTLEATFLTSNPMPFDKVAAPFFISDGKNENYVPRDIVSSKTGKSVMTVDEFQFFLNQCLPYLAIRLDSWRDATTLSVCYNEANYSRDEATSFLDTVASYMLTFAK